MDDLLDLGVAVVGAYVVVPMALVDRRLSGVVAVGL